MTKRSQANWQTVIKRNVALLVALIVFVLSSSWGYVSWQNSKIDTLKNLSENYHYKIYRNCSDIQLELRNIMLYICPLESSINQENLPDFIETEGDFGNSLYIASENIRIIGGLQKSFNVDKFELLTNKAVNLFTILKAKQTIFENKTYKINSELNNEFLELLKSLEQLKRLHKVERAKLEKKIIFQTKANEIQLYSIIGGIVLILSLITFNIFRSIRSVIDRQKSYESNLRKLTKAIEQSPASVVITDQSGNIEYVNQEFIRRTGYSHEEVVGKNSRILKSGKQPYEFYVKLWSTIRDGYEWKGRLCNKTKSGKLFWEYESINAVKDNKGNIKNFVAVKIDETERVRAEKELLKSQKSLVEAQRVAHLGNWEWDIINNKLHWSEEIYNIFGVHRHNFQPTYESFLEAVHPEDRDLVKMSFNDTLFGNVPYNVDYRIVVSDGAERFIHEQAEVTFDKDRKPIQIIGVVHDITERKRLEEEILKAKKLESLGILAGGIAHDFNNLLAIVLGNANLVGMFLKSGNYDKINETNNNIEKAAIRAKDLTVQLLTFAKGGAPVKKLSTIADIIKDLAEFFIKGSNVKCEFLIPDNLWSVEIDIGQISQVIDNMVVNADQAMPDGGIITIKAANITRNKSIKIASLKPGNYVKLSIKDEGVGMSEKTMQRIFDPYFTTKQLGSGLGLAASYAIINKHGGFIEVESEIDIGSTFSIYLQASSKETDKKRDEAENAHLVASGNILIMDDDEQIREMAKQTLGFVGYNVMCTKDGDETLKLYKDAKQRNEPFNAVIMDLTIPGGMGGEVCIKKLLEVDPEVKAIVFSGYSNDPVLADFEKHGFKGVISKPFQIKEINELLQRVINGRS